MSTATAARQHLLVEMDRTGDTKHVWDPDSETEVAEMRRLFDSLKAKGYLIYRVKRNGEKAESMPKFDPEAEKMIASPGVVAG